MRMSKIRLKEEPQPDWDPLSPEVQKDQRAAYDAMRRRCPVAYSEALGWSLFRHADVMRVLLDHKTFSNAVSRHLSVPNGMDAPEHTIYRKIIDRYFVPEKMIAFEPVCRKIARELIAHLVDKGEIDFIPEFSRPYAVRVQCAFLGWPKKLHASLARWTQKNHEATRAQDRRATSEIAQEFEKMMDALLEDRRQSQAGPESDLTASLLFEQAWKRPLSNEEIASILRNWTVGEIGTISASTGILAHYMAAHPSLQKELRNHPDRLFLAIEEILRIQGPLVSNRRIARQDVEIGGRRIKAGDRVTVMWISANRDEEVFEEPDVFRLDRDPQKNLLWGAGIHVCPGAPLARLEMRVFMEELLKLSKTILPVPNSLPVHAQFPASGFSTLPIQIDGTIS